ncbi:hypothetical protein ACT7DO_28625 [Bacillus pacificus]
MKFTSVRKLVLFIIATVLATFFLISMMVTSMKETKSTYLYNWLNELSMNGYMYVLGKENHYFTQEYRNLNQDFSISSFLFSMATNIRFNDVRSFVGKELPGFGKSTIAEIVIAGEGTNYSNLPIESSVPLEEVVKERTGEGGQAQKAGYE